jgi:hypothetical protein
VTVAVFGFVVEDAVAEGRHAPVEDLGGSRARQFGRLAVR